MEDLIKYFEKTILHLEDLHCKNVCRHYVIAKSCVGCGTIKDIEKAKEILEKLKKCKN